MNCNVVILSLVILLSGCATQGTNTFKYNPSTLLKIPNEITVSKPYSEVWDGLVKELSKSFYVINNIDKESRIINLSFSSSSPSDFVDCGKSYRTYKQGDKLETYNYNVAGSAKFKVATEKQEHPSFVNYVLINRKPNLEGRSNIYIAPEEHDKTRTSITVNTRYIVSVIVKGEAFAEHVNGNVFSRGQIPENTTTVSFNTNQIGQVEVGNPEMLTCVSKGKLEKEVLEMVVR